MTYEKKIYSGLLVVIGAFLPLVCVSLFAIHKLIDDEKFIIESNAKQTLLIERLQFFNAAQSRQLLLYIFTKEKSQLKSYYEFNGLFNSVLAEIVRLETDPPDLVLLAKLKVDSDAVHPYREQGIRMVDQGKSGETIAHYFQKTSAALSREISDTAQQLAISAAQTEADANARRDSSIKKLEEAIFFLAFLATILLVWATQLIVKVSRQKRLTDEQSARISNARKEIVEIVSHDIKNPISTILISVDMMKLSLAEEQTNSNLQTSLGMIERSAKTVRQLITDLLDHTKIESGNLVLDSKPCDLGEIVENVATRFKLLAQAKSLQFKIQVPGDEMISSCDPARIDQVLSNLLGNAIKFTPNGGTVTICCKKTEKGIAISVEDSGVGVSEEQIPHLFDRYWQVNKSSQQGSGLGLAIVKSIIDAHRGQIQVESVPKKGTKFNLLLPHSV